MIVEEGLTVIMACTSFSLAIIVNHSPLAFMPTLYYQAFELA